ncbi:MAG: metallophosphoesterase [Clostridiales bacterium]|nr:metallophosphoesterase [Clostridiales bacterium]
MSLYAIADTHLSFGTNKSMDTFEGWENYTKRLEKNWNRLVTENDDVVIAGDISWAMNFDELKADFDFIEKLNGNKIILKGNHDYWWNTLTKLNNFIKINNYKTIRFLHNNSYTCGNVSVCGSRGWMIENSNSENEKILKREIQRIKISLDNSVCKNKIVFLHYPPLTQNAVCGEIIDLFKEYEIKKCFFGHLHGEAAKYSLEGIVDGIEFKLISCDKLKFTPYLILRY